MQLQAVLLAEALLDFRHGLRQIEQAQLAAFGRHAAMDEGQMVREEDDRGWVVEYHPASHFTLQGDDGER
ncbi:hypothetical protein D3C72_2273620 [compost metagenome]